MFFQSLLPTFNAQEMAPAADPELAIAPPAVNPFADRVGLHVENVAGAIDEAAVGTEQRTSLGSIMDVMRDFLSNIRVERPNDADVDENESSDEEPDDYLT